MSARTSCHTLRRLPGTLLPWRGQLWGELSLVPRSPPSGPGETMLAAPRRWSGEGARREGTGVGWSAVICEALRLTRTRGLYPAFLRGGQPGLPPVNSVMGRLLECVPARTSATFLFLFFPFATTGPQPGAFHPQAAFGAFLSSIQICLSCWPFWTPAAET